MDYEWEELRSKLAENELYMSNFTIILMRTEAATIMILTMCYSVKLLSVVAACLFLQSPVCVYCVQATE